MELYTRASRLKYRSLHAAWESNDGLARLTTGERLRGELSSPELVILEQTGHAVQEENPAALIPCLDAFLED